MRKFTCTKGHDWHVEVNAESLRRVKTSLQLDLTDIQNGRLFDRLGTDYLLASDVAYWLCKPQADSRNLSYDAFMGGLSGDSLGDATTAVAEAVIDFFPGAKREILSQAYQRVCEIQGTLNDSARNALNDPALQEKIKEQLHSVQSAQ